MPKTIIEPFKIKSVEPIFMSTEAERERYIKEAHYNPFLLHSRQVTIDLLTDSGTSAMSSEQWAGIMRGDESYAGASSWDIFYNEVRDLTGFEYVLPTHQGRAAERILYSQLGGAGKVFLSNTHFDTTRANIEFGGAAAIDIPTRLAADHDSDHHFKGDIDLDLLESNIAKYGRENIAAVILTVTNNSGGGQPVSMQNARSVSEICRRENILLILDCCRIAENAWFIHQYEDGFDKKTYREIAQEMFGLVDGCVMSAKKDALVNMGGFLGLKDAKLAEECTNLLIITEGFVTYGGLAGRDMEAIAQGFVKFSNPNISTIASSAHVTSASTFGPKGYRCFIRSEATQSMLTRHSFIPTYPQNNIPVRCWYANSIKEAGSGPSRSVP